MIANREEIERYNEQIVDLKEKDSQVYDRTEEIKIEIANLRSNINENSVEIDRLQKLIEDNEAWIKEQNRLQKGLNERQKKLLSEIADMEAKHNVKILSKFNRNL